MARPWQSAGAAERPEPPVADAGVRDCRRARKRANSSLLAQETQARMHAVVRSGGVADARLMEPRTLLTRRRLESELQTEESEQKVSLRASALRLPPPRQPVRQHDGGVLPHRHPLAPRLPVWARARAQQPQSRGDDVSPPVAQRRALFSHAPNERVCGRPDRRSAD